MASVSVTELAPAAVRRGRDYFWIFAFLAVAALFLFLDRSAQPIVLWDESRTIVNALEMRRSGFSLVTTYEFQPDLWNTKPPLMIWLMTGSMALFGPSEWALRLPSMLAALGTLLLLILFARRVTGSIATGLIAAAFLLLSPGFFGEHGARTADYDMPLLFFTTAYLQQLFMLVHRRDPSTGHFLLAGTLIALACLTKSVAGLIPGAGAMAYVLISRRATRVFGHHGYWRMAAVAAVPVLAFLVLRESIAPGYLEAAWNNDVLGRFNGSLLNKDEPAYFHARELLLGWFFAGPALVFIPLALRYVSGKSRAALLYSLVTTLAVLMVISLSGTKLIQYSLAIFPALALASAIALRALCQRFWARRHAGRGSLSPFYALAMAFFLLNFAYLGMRAVDWRYRHFPDRQSYAQAQYGHLFAILLDHGFRRVDVMDEGYAYGPTDYYAPQLRGYALLLRERGLIVRHHRDTVAPRSGLLASCDPRFVMSIRQGAHPVVQMDGCAAFWIG